MPMDEIERPRYSLRPMLLVLLLPLALIVANPVSWPEKSWPHELMEWSGYLLAIIGAYMQIYATVFTSSGELATAGPYSVVRHPSYIGLLVMMTGIGLETASLPLVAFALAIAVPICLWQARREEIEMLGRFGVRYAKYQERVRAWLPRLQLWDEISEVAAKPRTVMDSMLRNSALLMLYPIFEITHMLHQANVLQTFTFTSMP